MSAFVMDVLVVQMYETGFKFFATRDSLGKDIWEHPSFSGKLKH